MKVHKVRGMDEEDDVFIRLADALAGFVRDGEENHKEFRNLYIQAKKKKIIQEV